MKKLNIFFKPIENRIFNADPSFKQRVREMIENRRKEEANGKNFEYK
jgi:hypothetical protein